MMRRSSLASVVCFVSVSILSASTAFGATRYVEDFTTTTYRDAGNTTADWNMAAGELRLYSLPIAWGSYQPSDSVFAVAVAGDLAFLACGSAGLRILDITDPGNPSLTGTYDTPGEAYGVAVAGDYAFVADGASGLQVVDIGNPAVPFLAGTYDTPDEAFAVAVAGDHAFVADGLSGLEVLDISNPSGPTLVGNYDTPDFAVDVALAGDLAFIADGASGVQVVSILNPAGPTLVGSYNTPGLAFGVAVAGNHAYVGDGSSGLEILDITNPAAPSLAGTYDTPGAAARVALWGDLAFVADGDAGVQAVDIANPAGPFLAGTFDTPGSAFSVAVSGNLAFVADTQAGLCVLKTAFSTAPTVAGTFSTVNPATGIVVDGDLAFLAQGVNGLEIVDLSDPLAPAHLGSYTAVGTVSGVAVDGDLAFLSDEALGLIVLNVSNPASPTLAGDYSLSGTHYGVAVSGNLAFLASSGTGLRILDITNPASPSILGTYNTPGNAYGVAVSGDYAFVADGSSGLRIVNITNPSSPSPEAGYNMPGNAQAVAVAGDLAFVADGNNGLVIVDVTNPASPAPAGTYDTPGNAVDVTVSGDYAYVADDGGGLVVLDVSNPASPSLVGSASTGQAVAVAGDYAFLQDWGTGLHTIRVMEHGYDTGRNLGWSLPVDEGTDAIRRVRLTTTQTDTVTWEVSCDGGTSWQSIVPGDPWSTASPSGTDLLWRSTHVLGPSGVNPAVSALELDWLYDHPVIESVTDIPNDQGKQVRVEWTRSAHDFAGDPSQIVQYAVYRKIDYGLGTQAEAAPRYGTASLQTLDPALRRNVQEMAAAGWDFLVTVPVLTEDSYAVVVPTLKDSTVAQGSYFTTFRVTALTATPGVFFHSPPDSGYSLDNLAPSPPSGVVIAYGTGSGNTLSWDESTDPDLQYYGIYRSPGLAPAAVSREGDSRGALGVLSSPVLVATTTATSWVDPDYDQAAYSYAVTATDFSGNESAPASPGTVTAAGGPEPPRTFAVYPGAPNPFRASTVIRYAVPEGGGGLSLKVYDVGGRLVRTLVEGARPAGLQSVTWDGRDDRGRAVDAGVYFYRLTATDYSRTRKLVLMR